MTELNSLTRVNWGIHANATGQPSAQNEELNYPVPRELFDCHIYMEFVCVSVHPPPE